MSKPWQPYARYIADMIAKIYRISARGSLLADEVLYDATLRNLQTLSEATQHLPDELKALYPDIPWRQISGFRNILVHSYLGGDRCANRPGSRGPLFATVGNRNRRKVGASTSLMSLPGLSRYLRNLSVAVLVVARDQENYGRE